MRVASFKLASGGWKVFDYDVPHEISFSSVISDIINIGLTVFQLERFIKSGKEIKEVKISLFNSYDEERIKENLEDILLLLLGKRIETNIEVQKFQQKIEPIHIKSTNICLFSGGVDSFSGILNSKEKFNDVLGVFVRHTNQGKVENVVNLLELAVLNKHNINNRHLLSLAHGMGLMQTRGFLYTMSGAAYAYATNSQNIVVSECGPTMFQPHLLPLDDVTLTTNPQLLEKTKQLLKILAGKDYKIIRPHEDVTKSEIIANCPEKDYLKYTHSCLRTGYAGNPISHDGNCYGCVVRKLSFLVADVKDAEYAYDVIVKRVGDNAIGLKGEQNAKIGSQMFRDILPLIDFTSNFLFHYDKLPFTAKFEIESYGKYELFRRFSFDIFSGLYILYEKLNEGKNQLVEKLYQNARKNITKDELENRIAEVREKRFKPNFNNFV